MAPFLISPFSGARDAFFFFEILIRFVFFRIGSSRTRNPLLTRIHNITIPHFHTYTTVVGYKHTVCKQYPPSPRTSIPRSALGQRHRTRNAPETTTRRRLSFIFCTIILN